MPGFFGGTRHFVSNSSSNGQFQNKGPQCAYCKRWGHIRRFCPKLLNKNNNNNNSNQEQPGRVYLPTNSNQNRGRGSSRGFYPRRRNFPRANTATSITEGNIDIGNQQLYEDDVDGLYDDDTEISNLAAGKVVPGLWCCP